MTDTLPATQVARRGEDPAPRRALRVTPTLVHVVSLVAAAAALARANWGQWFFGDEWAFLVSRDLGDDPWRALFAPHNEHWSTLPVLVWRAMLHIVGLESYLPYVAVLITVHLTLAHLLWRVMLRCGAAAWVATGLAAVFAVLGAGSENLLWAFQIGFIGSVLFGYLAVMVSDAPRVSGARLLSTWLLSAAALMCSGIGVVMVGVVVLLAWQRRGLRAAAIVAGGPAALFVAWYLAIGGGGGSAVPRSRRGAFSIPDYVASGLTQSLERTVGLPSSGALLTLVILAWIAIRASARSIPPVALATAAGAVALYAFIAPGREALGIESAGAQRYTYICVALLLPSCALLVTELVARTRWPAFLAVTLAVVLVWHNLYLLIGTYGAEAGREALIRRQVLAAADIAATESWLRNRPEPTLDPDITMEWLREARSEGWLDEDEGTYTPKDELDVRARTQVALSAPAARDLPPVTVVATARVEAAAQGACTDYTPSGPEPQLVVSVDPRTGGSAQLLTSAPGELRVYLGSASAPGVLSEPAILTTDAPAAGVSLDVMPGVERMIVTLPGTGTTSVCGVVVPSS